MIPWQTQTQKFSGTGTHFLLPWRLSHLLCREGLIKVIGFRELFEEQLCLEA